MGAGLQWEESLGCGRVRREGVVGGKGRVGNGRRKDTGSHGELWPDPERQSEALRLVSGSPSGTLSPRHSRSLVQPPRKAV